MWRLNQAAKNACLAEIGAVFKSFSVFPRIFVTVHLLSKLSPFQTLRESIFKPHWCFISYPNHQEKVWVLLSQSHFPFSWMFLLLFGLILCLKYFSLCVMGMACYVCYCSHLFSCWAVTMCFFIVLIFACCWVWKSFIKWVWSLFDLLISLAWVLMLDFGIGLLSFYDNIMFVSQPCALVWMLCYCILKYFPMFISLVEFNTLGTTFIPRIFEKRD